MLPATLQRAYLAVCSICCLAACIGFASAFWWLWNGPPPTKLPDDLLRSTAMLSLLIGLMGLAAGTAVLRSWRQALSTSNIPEPDRSLIESLLSSGNRVGVCAYLDLSSLRGATVSLGGLACWGYRWRRSC